MHRFTFGLAIAALALLLGCQQSGTSESPSAAASAAGGTTTDSSNAGTSTTSATTTTTTTSASGMSATATTEPPAEAPKEVTMPSGLKYQDLVVGTGAVAEAGKNVSVHYTGWLTDGTKFDSSVDRGQPYPFTLGSGTVIRGWDEGIAGMRVGGKRKLTIPPALAYGERGRSGTIPPNSTLLFDVELVDVK